MREVCEILVHCISGETVADLGPCMASWSLQFFLNSSHYAKEKVSIWCYPDLTFFWVKLDFELRALSRKQNLTKIWQVLSLFLY
jgi:hypothetical protein